LKNAYWTISILSLLGMVACSSMPKSQEDVHGRTPAAAGAQSTHPCAPFAAQAALEWAAKGWNLPMEKQKVLFVEDRDGNPPPTKGFGVGIRRQDHQMVQFNVFFTVQDGQCLNPEVSFAESGE
jgi:hypothetical protein